MLSPFRGRPPKNCAYRTDLGQLLKGRAEKVLEQRSVQRLAGRVNLVFTSPPFPLNRKKKYGNLTGERYISWLSEFSSALKNLLAPDGSIVIELGSAWEEGRPVLSTLALEALLSFARSADLKLCQEFIWFNPAKLPSPAQWVTVERIRVKDSFTRLWWLSPVDRPKADNRRVLQEYSNAMKDLLRTQKYNAGRRPSEHHIGERSFLKDNGGAIPPNVLSYSNTHHGEYQRYCKEQGLVAHPARMPLELAEFFVNFLTDPGDLVLDPFAGSNTTGAAAESLGRHWLSIEAKDEYIAGSVGRFQQAGLGL